MFKEAQIRRERNAAKRAFGVIELARRLNLSAEAAEGVYDRAEGDLVRAVLIAQEEGLVAASELPPITAVGRKS